MVHSASSSAKEPFPLLNVEADSAPNQRAAATGIYANGSATTHRRKQSADGPGNLATSLAHLSGVDIQTLTNGKVRGREEVPASFG